MEKRSKINLSVTTKQSITFLCETTFTMIPKEECKIKSKLFGSLNDYLGKNTEIKTKSITLQSSRSVIKKQWKEGPLSFYLALMKTVKRE